MRSTIERAAAPAVPRAASVVPRSGLPLLALQKSAGNRAATAWVQRSACCSSCRAGRSCGEEPEELPAAPRGAQVQRRAGRPTVRTGSSGPDVADAQQAVGTGPDGIFGPQTDSAVRSFQGDHALAPDGVVGPVTWAAIDGQGASGASAQGAAPAGKQTAADDFRIKGLPDDSQEHPDIVYFDLAQSVVPAQEDGKLANLAARPGDLRLDGSSSEEGQGNQALTDARLLSVDRALVAHAHLGQRARRNLTARSEGSPDYRHARRVQVVPAGTPDTQAGCAAGGNVVPCPATVGAAYDSAADLLLKAILKLGSPSILTPADRALVRQTFVDDSDAAIGEVAGHMADLRQFVIDSKANVRQPGQPDPAAGPFHECIDQCDATCAAGALASNRGVDTTSSTTFCEGFTTMSAPAPGTGTTVAESQQHIAIHESAHGTRVIDCQDFAKGSQRAFGLLTRDQALHNADSFTSLARNLVNPGSAAMRPLTPDTGNQAGDAGVQEPLAWLDRWLEASDFDTSQVYGALVQTAGEPLQNRSPQFAEALRLIAEEFPEVTSPPAVPSRRDRERVAAINDRYDHSRKVLGTNSASLTLLSSTILQWSDGPGRTVTIPPGFTSLPMRQRIEALAAALFRAATDVSAGREGAYARLAPKLTNRRTPGFAFSVP